jgi:hypothetical protein
VCGALHYITRVSLGVYSPPAVDLKSAEPKDSCPSLSISGCSHATNWLCENIRRDSLCLGFGDQFGVLMVAARLVREIYYAKM